MELLVAIVIGGILIISSTIAVLSLIRNNFENRGAQIGSSIAYDLINRVKSLSKSDWHLIYNKSKGSSSHYFVVPYATSSAIVQGDESVLFNNVSANLVGHWKFDEATGTTAYDSSGKFNNGTLISSPARIASSSCKVGSCLNFNGSNYVNIGNPSELQITGDQTIVMWIKPSDLSSRRNPFAKAYGGEGTITQETDGKLTYYYGTAGGNASPYQDFSTGIPVVSSGNWTFISVVRDLTNMKLYWYINGDLISSTNALYSSAATSSLDVYIGKGYVSNYVGYIDDIRIYNRALSANEISELYNSSVYTRYFYIENVMRDNNGIGNIVSSGGVNDESTQKITVNASWEDNRSINFSTYLTRNFNNLFYQINWFDGSGVDGPITTATTTYSSSNNITASTNLSLATTTSSGYLISSIFDTQIDGGVAVNSIIWQGTKPSGTNVKFQLAYSNSSSGPWNYIGSDGSSSTYFTPTDSGVSLPINIINNYRYLRYKVYLFPYNNQSPSVDGIYINFSK